MSVVCALDLGSNSFHLLVAECKPARAPSSGRLKRLETTKRPLRLGDPVARTGELGQEARARAVEAVGELLGSARGAGAGRVVAVATEALRVAADGARLLDELADRFGLPVRLIDGLAEADLSLQGMTAALHLRPGHDLLGIDLGGGSYEVAYGGHGCPKAAVSLPLGGARLAARPSHDPPRLAERVTLHAEALELLAPVTADIRRQRHTDGPPRTAGTAGTIRELGRLALALASGVTPQRIRGLVVTRAQLELAVARLAAFTTVERAQLPGVSARRADLLPACGIVVLATMESFDLEHLELCDWGLREGVLLDAFGQHRVVDERDLVPLGAA